MAGGLHSAWIIGRRADVPLILAAPLLSVLVLVPMSWWISPRAIWVAVMSFGSVGHHVPGFLRTYGDLALFRRYRARFVVAPIVVFAAAYWFAGRNLHGVLLVSLVWSVWHGMMQHYGFMRVYDARARIFDHKGARLDLAITVSWFALCLTLSPEQSGSILDGLMEVGIIVRSPVAVEVAQWAAIAATAVTTAAYVSFVRARRAAGEPVSLQKLVLLVSTAALVWFARVMTTDPFLSVVLFEVVHDVQYLAIVWAFNRNIVDKKVGGGRFAAALFRRGAIAPSVYVGLCLAWGGLGYVATGMPRQTELERVLTALLLTSGLLHFYFDGFIWKVRQSNVRSGIGAAEQGAVADGRGHSPRDLVHLGLFLLVLGLLYRAETGASARDPLDTATAMVDMLPRSATAHRNVGAALVQTDAKAAEEHLRRAIELAPRVADNHLALAKLLAGRDSRGAVEAADAAIELEPDHAGAHAQRGMALLSLGDLSGGVLALRRGIELGDEQANTHGMLGLALARQGQGREAAEHLRHAASLDPDDVRFVFNLGTLLASGGDWPAAARAFERATQVAPDLAAAHNALGAAYIKLGRREDARGELQTALRLDPTLVPARRNLALLSGR